MSYFVLSRKYRPQKFTDVVAQEHITETLTKAIEHDRVAQAYLFCGVRGTGKTSIARILAKRLNCQTPNASEPCNRCDSCKGIIDGSSLDVLEIDAASNTSVDDIRELRESIKYAPLGGKHKVYIIDEVHRLSPSAFDALLKTLEEPPAHAVFIFATTEVHKVPQTILSRCQRYDFKRITEIDLKDAIKDIAAREGLAVTDDARAELARRADGSLRDALSLLDQVASWQRDTIDLDLLSKALGILPRSEYRRLLAKIINRDSAAIIEKIGAFLTSGISAGEFVRGFQEELRVLLILKTAPQIAENLNIDLGDEIESKEILDHYSVNDLLRMQNLMVNLEQKIRDGFEPRINLELALLKMVSMESSATIAELMRQLAGNPDPALSESSKKKLKLTGSVPDFDHIPKKVPTNEAHLQEIWSNLLSELKTDHRFLLIKLRSAVPRSIGDKELVAAFPGNGEFSLKLLVTPENRKTLQDTIKKITGKELKLHFVIDKDLSPKQETVTTKPKLSETELEEHPLVRETIELFDAEVVGREDLPGQ